MAAVVYVELAAPNVTPTTVTIGGVPYQTVCGTFCMVKIKMQAVSRTMRANEKRRLSLPRPFGFGSRAEARNASDGLEVYIWGVAAAVILAKATSGDYQALSQLVDKIVREL
jgi:hypothetical protein